MKRPKIGTTIWVIDHNNTISKRVYKGSNRTEGWFGTAHFTPKKSNKVYFDYAEYLPEDCFPTKEKAAIELLERTFAYVKQVIS